MCLARNDAIVIARLDRWKMNTVQSSHAPGGGGGGKLKSDNAMEVRNLNYVNAFTLASSYN